MSADSALLRSTEEPTLPRREAASPVGTGEAAAPPPFRPAPPQSLTEAGLNEAMVDSIIFKYLRAVGSASGARIAATLALPHPLIVERLADLKQQQLLGYVGGVTMGDFTYTLTDSGRERARKCLEESMYILRSCGAPGNLANCRMARPSWYW